MKVIIMAGGRGVRLRGAKKPLLHICGKRLADVVVSAVKSLGMNVDIYICISDYTRELVDDLSEDVKVILCPGRGYVHDLNYALNLVKPPALVLPSDIPFLTSEIIHEFLRLAGVVDADVITLMSCSDLKCSESGISLFKRERGRWVNIYFRNSTNLRDIDVEDDLRWAENLCGTMGDVVGGSWTSA